MVDEELQPRYENSYALIIGVNSYTDPSFAPLGEAEEDAEILADVLSSEPHNFRVRTILGEQATKRNILQSMYDLRATEPDDRILVYFACHGYTLTARFGKESGYLAAFDTVPQQDFTALHMEEVLVLRRHAGAKHIAFIFDACFSGQALGLTRAQSVAAEKFLTRRAYQVLSAGAGDQTVSDYNSMTRLLINALTGPMISADGVYTLGDLGQHVQTTMAGDSNQWQIPQFGHVRGSQGGDFVFHYEQGVTLHHEIQTALYSENSHLRWGGVAAIIELLENPHTDPDML
ncbi:MAG: caspase domain-containing protein, partial [Anaerolineae bacterium]